MRLLFYNFTVLDCAYAALILTHHPRSLCAWTSSVECEPGFFKDVLQHIEELIKLDEKNADCSLVCDRMAIKNNIMYNKGTNRYLGYINLGSNILVDAEDKATEALVFMLVSLLRKSWKYPIGYVFIDKINAGTLNSLLSKAQRQGLEHNIKIRNVTMATNFSAMRVFGCKLGRSLTLIDGQFHFEGYDYHIPAKCPGGIHPSEKKVQLGSPG